MGSPVATIRHASLSPGQLSTAITVRPRNARPRKAQPGTPGTLNAEPRSRRPHRLPPPTGIPGRTIACRRGDFGGDRQPGHDPCPQHTTTIGGNHPAVCPEAAGPTVAENDMPMPASVLRRKCLMRRELRMRGTCWMPNWRQRLEDLRMDSLMGTEATGKRSSKSTRAEEPGHAGPSRNVFFSLKGRYEGIASKRQLQDACRERGHAGSCDHRFSKERRGLYESYRAGASVAVGHWSDLVEGAIIEARVTGSNTGGLELNVNNIRGFMPASQIDIVRIENFGDYVNQKLQCVVAEVERGAKLVLSRRAILEREKNERKRSCWRRWPPDRIVGGHRYQLMDFGAFPIWGGSRAWCMSAR